MTAAPPKDKALSLALLAVVVLALAVSAIGPKDRFTWLLEVTPVLLGLPLVVLSHKYFPLTRLLMVLLAVHAFVPVAALHHGLAAASHPSSRTEQFTRRRGEVLAGNARGLAILRERAKPTASGARLVDELERLHEALVAAAPDGPPRPRDEAMPG